MTGLFLKIVNMSISASWLVLVVLLLRLLLKKAPKWINCVLWGIVALRLICPFNFESALSLMPSAETISKPIDSPRPYIASGVNIIDNPVNTYLRGRYFEGVTRPTGNFVDITTIIAVVWCIGIVALLIYTLVSFLRLKRKVGTAVLLRDNIYGSENVASPFVIGIIKPKIYLPFNMSEEDMENVIAHERAHIKRKDHLWKPLGFLLLTLHWFNPLMWLSYVLLCRDIELASDERVVKDFDKEQKADYSQALLNCSVNRPVIAACPLAFGEVGVKSRVKSVLNYKKPAFWFVVVAVILSVATAVCFLTNPKSDVPLFGSHFETGKCLYSDVVPEDKSTRTDLRSFIIHNSRDVDVLFDESSETYLGKLTQSDLTIKELNEKLTAQRDVSLRLSAVEEAYEIKAESFSSDYAFLKLKNGDVLLVSFFTDGGIMDVFELDFVSAVEGSFTDPQANSEKKYLHFTYSYDENIKVYPTLFLEESGNEALFAFQDYENYSTKIIGKGIYKLGEKELTLECENNVKYVFRKVDEDVYKFDPEKSGEEPTYIKDVSDEPIKLSKELLFIKSGESNILPVETVSLPELTKEALFTALSEKGYTFNENKDAEGYLNGKYSSYKLTDGDYFVSVYEYKNTEKAEKDKECVSEDGSGIYTKKNAMQISWVASNYWYQKDSLIVHYVGSDKKIAKALKEILGESFAGYEFENEASFAPTS